MLWSSGRLLRLINSSRSPHMREHRECPHGEMSTAFPPWWVQTPLVSMGTRVAVGPGMIDETSGFKKVALSPCVVCE